MNCPFCEEGEALAIIRRDAYPVTEGHLLVVPRRHVASIFDLPSDELAAVWEAVIAARRSVRGDANIGINDGACAGQTVQHAHIHVIPRSAGDVPDPRGGVRWVIPARADYWSLSPTVASDEPSSAA